MATLSCGHFTPQTLENLDILSQGTLSQDLAALAHLIQRFIILERCLLLANKHLTIQTTNAIMIMY